MLCISAAYAVVYVRASVRYFPGLCRKKNVCQFFSPSGSHTILVFRIKRYGNIPTETLMGASNAGGVGKDREANIWLSDRWLVECDQLRRSTVHLTALTATHQWMLFITTSMDDHDVEKRREHNLFVRSGKSEAEVTNNIALEVLVCPEKSEPPQTFCTDKCKHSPYWTKLSMHSPRSICVIFAKFRKIPSYHLTDFQFLHIVVTDFSYRHDLLIMHDASHVMHDVILSINKMLSKEDRVLIKVLRVKRDMVLKE